MKLCVVIVLTLTQIYGNHGRAFGAYSYKQGASERRFSGVSDGSLTNETAHQMATALLDIST